MIDKKQLLEDAEWLCRQPNPAPGNPYYAATVSRIASVLRRVAKAEHGFDLIVNDEWVAGGTGPAEAIEAEANHYAMMYAQDGSKLELVRYIRVESP